MARLHVSAFPDSAITAFGHELVERYYAWLHEGPHDAAVVGAFLDDRLIGFCAAGVFRNAMNGFLRDNRVRIAAHLARHPRLLASPLIRERIRDGLRITVRFSRLLRARPAGPSTPNFGVLAIGTDPDFRGTGAGRALMLEAEARARAGGFRRMTLTVHPHNTRAIRFYEQLGWARTSTQQPWAGSMFKVLEGETR